MLSHAMHKKALKLALVAVAASSNTVQVQAMCGMNCNCSSGRKGASAPEEVGARQEEEDVESDTPEEEEEGSSDDATGVKQKPAAGVAAVAEPTGTPPGDEVEQSRASAIKNNLRQMAGEMADSRGVQVSCCAFLSTLLGAYMAPEKVKKVLGQLSTATGYSKAAAGVKDGAKQAVAGGEIPLSMAKQAAAGVENGAKKPWNKTPKNLEEARDIYKRAVGGVGSAAASFSAAAKNTMEHYRNNPGQLKTDATFPENRKALGNAISKVWSKAPSAATVGASIADATAKDPNESPAQKFERMGLSNSL